METSQLLSFHDVGRLPCSEEFDAPKFHVKELRIKDLHKNLCKRPQSHINFLSRTRASPAEASEQHGEKAKRFGMPTESSETKYESCEDDVMDESEAVRSRPFSFKPPFKPHLREEDLRSSKCEGAKPEVNSHKSRNPTETDAVISPVRQSDDDANSGESGGLDASASSDVSTYSSYEQGRSSTSIMDSKLPPFSGKRHPEPRRRSRGPSVGEYECLDITTDPEPGEGCDGNPQRRKKLRSKSLHAMIEILSTSTEASEEEIPPAAKKRGRTIASKLKEIKGKAIHRALNRKKGKNTASKSKQSKASRNPMEGKSVRTSKSSITNRKLKYGYFSEETSDEMELDTDSRDRDHPTFAVEMKRSNVIVGFSLTIPAEFSSKHMPDQSEYVVLQDTQGLKWEANYLPHKKCLSGGWGRFARDHHLELGDVIVFELVKPLKFRVHVTGGSENRRAK